jgi:hypothetical protein
MQIHSNSFFACGCQVITAPFVEEPPLLLCQKSVEARHGQLTPVILATQEAEIRRIEFEVSPRQIV